MAITFKESTKLGTVGSGSYVFRHYGNAGAINYYVLEYLYSSGNAYIDTGVTGGTYAGYDLGIKIETVSKAWARYMGGGDLPDYPVPVSNQGSTGSRPITIGSYYSGSLHNYVTFYPDTVWRTINVDGGNVSLDGTLQTTTASNSGWSSTSCYLFSTHGWTGGAGACYISYCKMYIDGVLVRDFVPVRRDYDNVLGMFDKVNNKFYQSNGGTFTGGNETGEIITV